MCHLCKEPSRTNIVQIFFFISKVLYVFRLGSKLVLFTVFLNIYFYQSGTVQIGLLLV